ncbi:glycosyl transferase [Shimazuella sp. AN120528]|uniref:macrolide family glycosyltransferase n=1 Tax=Shimazuella soli TaxID=1892854 RepID=UPI001F10816D|nr:macrolide family glycosyltransferase [Shimazuella soli]MCH5585169.1 glycosyl transferase [Shimazuella soli]
MSNVLFFNVARDGHVNPTLGIIKELVNRGEKVTYYCSREYRDRIEQTGATFRAYEKRLDKTNTPDTPMMFLIYHMLRDTEHRIRTILPKVQEEEYDYVIFDSSCAAGWIIADILHLPKISSCSMLAMDQRNPKVDRKSYTEVDREYLVKSKEILNNLKKAYALNSIPLHDFKRIMSFPGDLTFVFTSKYFQNNADQFDETFRFVGPSITLRKDAENFPYEKLQGKPVIYISMGTIVNQQVEFYQKCFRAFAGMDAKVVLSVGKNTKIEELGTIPDNFIVRNYVPQLEILQHTDVFFTHGGMNSASEGLYFATPLAVLPISNDQPMVAKRVKELGAGIQLDFHRVTPAVLRETAELLLSDSTYKQHAHKIGDSFRGAGGYQKVVDDIFEWKGSTFE